MSISTKACVEALTTAIKEGEEMLVLSRRLHESIMIGDNIIITVVGIRSDKVRLGIDAPLEIPVHRKEVYEAIQRDRQGNISSGAAENT